MNLTDQIEALFKMGVRNITIAQTDKDEPFIKAQQTVFGSEGNHIFTEHQIIGADVPTMFARLSEQAAHVAKFKPALATPKPSKILTP